MAQVDVVDPQLVLGHSNLPEHALKGMGTWSLERRPESPSSTGSSTRSSSPSSATPGMRRKSSRDPHRLPVHDSTSLTKPDEPILYLPPVLSSLPSGYSLPSEHTTSYRPLRTDSQLPEIDPVSLDLHKALHNFRPVTSEYAVKPYEESFNWDELLLPEDAESEWYAVVFRSKRKDGSDGGPLYEADKLAHEEAVRNGGLILYWYGIPHPTTGLNLATCIWQSRAHAIGAMSRPHHVVAMRLAAASYERYELQRFRLVKRRGERTLHVAPYDKGDNGW